MKKLLFLVSPDKVPVVFVSLSLDLCQKKDYAKNE